MFKLNKTYDNIALKNPLNIFILLNSIYTYKKRDISVAFDLFNEICIPINKDFFNKYYFDNLKLYDEYTIFKNVHMFNDYLSGEVSKMEVNNSYIKIKTNSYKCVFINYLLDNLFICNFNSKSFKYLTKVTLKK